MKPLHLTSLILLATTLYFAAANHTDKSAIVHRAVSHLVYADSVIQRTTRAQSIQVTVTASAILDSVTYDSNTGQYTYAYSLTNDVSSENNVVLFALAPVPEPSSIASPPHWSSYFGYEGNPRAIVWAVTDEGPAPADWDSVDVYPSPYDVQPGESVHGFQFVCRKPPTNITFYAQGFDTIPGGGEEEKPPPPTIFEDSVSGTIMGPDINSLVDVGDGPRGRDGAIEFHPPLPNPTSASVAVSFYLPTAADVKLGVYDVSGRRVRVLIDEQEGPGLHSVSWNGLDEAGRASAAGVYFYRLFVDGLPVGERRVVMLK